MSRTWTIAMRQRACAHASDCLGTVIREAEAFATTNYGPIGAAMMQLHSIYFIDSPADYYLRALLSLGLTEEAARAAVAAIEAGDLPANPRTVELVRLRAIATSARAVMAAPAILGGGPARVELARLLAEDADARDLDAEQESALGDRLAAAVTEGIMAAEEKAPEKYQEAKRKLLLWCEKSGVGAARRESVALAFKNRVADMVGPKRPEPVAKRPAS